jgi:thiol-disulfide isomerase/thioredoxin
MMYERKHNMQFETKNHNWNLTVLRTLAVLLALFFSLNFGQNATALENQQETGTSAQQPSGNPPNAEHSPVETLQKISQAQTDGKYLFLLFYETGNPDCETMSQNLDEFAQHTDQKVEIVKIDRKDPENTTIVSSMRVAFAPVPLTLVKDPNGQVVKSFKKVVSEEELLSAIPSPKKAQAMASLKDGKSLIISFISNAMPDGNKMEQSCEEAEKKLDGKAAHITVDVADPKEKGFLKEMRVSPDSAEPVAIVINAQRQMAGTFKADVKPDDLVVAATKVVAGGCCGGGGGKSCGPTRQ